MTSATTTAMMDVSFHSDDLVAGMDESERTPDSLDDFELDLDDTDHKMVVTNTSTKTTTNTDGSSSPRSVVPDSFLSASMSQLGHASDASLDACHNNNASVSSLPVVTNTKKKGPVVKAKRSSLVKKASKPRTKKNSSSHNTNSSDDDSSVVPPNNTLKKRLPADFAPSSYSVICGRGKDCFDSPGNIRFRGIIQDHMKDYLQAPGKSEKSKIVTHTMDMIRTACPNGGAFCKLEGDRWWEVSDRYAREKVGAWFRDCLHHEYKSSSKAKHARKMAQRKDGEDGTVKSSTSTSGKTTPTMSCCSEPHVSSSHLGSDLPPMGVLSSNPSCLSPPSSNGRNPFGFPTYGHPMGMPAHVSFHHNSFANSLDYSDHSAASFMSLQQQLGSTNTATKGSNINHHGMCHSMPALLTPSTPSPGVKDHARRRDSLCSIMTDGSTTNCGAFYDVDDLSLIPFDAGADALDLSPASLL